MARNFMLKPEVTQPASNIGPMSIWAGIWLESNANIALLRGNVGPYQLRILLDYKIGPMSQKDRNPKIRFDPDLPTLDQCRLGLELDIRTRVFYV